MAYRIRKKDTSVEEAVRRIAGEQIAKAVTSIDEAERAEVIHDVRKRCKKLRALIRLVRPVFAGYTNENAEFRDIARLISGARDAKVMQDTYDLLAEHYAHEIDRRALSSIRRRFTLMRKSEMHNGDVELQLAEVRDRLLEARERASSWTLEADGWRAISRGLARTLKRACMAADEAFADPSPEAIHELRKRLKYHWYHTRLLANLWPEVFDVRADLARDLTDQLGVHHDLSVFENHLVSDPLSFGSQHVVDAAAGLARSHRARIEEQAKHMTGKLLAQSPEALVKRWKALWKDWREPVSPEKVET